MNGKLKQNMVSQRASTICRQIPGGIKKKKRVAVLKPLATKTDAFLKVQWYKSPRQWSQEI